MCKRKSKKSKHGGGADRPAGNSQLLHGVGEVASAFISFSKADMAWVRESLHEALLAQSRVIWADWEDQPPSAEWTEFVHDGIEQHDVLIFVISPTSLHSAECAWEIDHALKLGKRIVPVVPPAHARTTARLDVALRGTPFAKELGEMRWVYFREWMAGTRPAAAASAASESSSSSSSSSSGEYYGDDQKPDDGRDGRDQDFRDSLTLLLREIDGDLEHTRMHTLLLKAALNWERRDFDKSMLLSAGPNPWSLKELNAARKWLSASALGIRPKPTPLHTSFIDASQSQVTAMQRRQIMAVCTAIMLGVGLFFPGWGVFFFMLIFFHFFVYLSSAAA